MSLFELFRPKKNQTASLAKERLQIIVAERRSLDDPAPRYLDQLKRDILKVISKYVEVELDMVQVSFEHKDDLSLLELNIKLPDEEK